MKSYNDTWETAFNEMVNENANIKLPTWGGFWYWDLAKDAKSDDDKTIMMALKEGGSIDIRETDRPKYTFANMARQDWIIIYPGDEDYGKIVKPYFDFETAKPYFERGMKMTAKEYEGRFYIIYEVGQYRLYNASNDKFMYVMTELSPSNMNDFTFYNDDKPVIERDGEDVADINGNFLIKNESDQLPRTTPKYEVNHPTVNICETIQSKLRQHYKQMRDRLYEVGINGDAFNTMKLLLLCDILDNGYDITDIAVEGISYHEMSSRYNKKELKE